MSVKFSFKLTWTGPAVLSRIEREVKSAVRKSAENVRRVVKTDALNNSGKAATNASDINNGSVQDRLDRNVLMPGIKKRKIRTKNASIYWGGTYRFFSKRHKRWYRVERVYWYGEPLHRWVQSSVPGTPPNKQTGTLQRSIAVEVASDGLRAKIGPGLGLKYARIQELGGKAGFANLPPRPYMSPSFDKSVPFTLNAFRVAIAKATS